MEKKAPTDVPILDVLSRRYSPRAFAERTVNDQDLHTLFEAARWAPSCFNEQPWRFIVASRDRQDEFDKMRDCLLGNNREWTERAGALAIIVASMRFSHNGKSNRHAWYDTGAAVAMLTVQATSMDIFAHQMAGFDAGKAREQYAIPEQFEPIAALALGYLGDPTHLSEPLRAREMAQRTRRPRSAFVYAGSWEDDLSG